MQTIVRNILSALGAKSACAPCVYRLHALLYEPSENASDHVDYQKKRLNFRRRALAAHVSSPT